MTTKSPAETLGQQAEAVSGKRMSWMDTAARLALPIAGLGVPILGVGTELYNRREQERRDARDAQWFHDRLERNYLIPDARARAQIRRDRAQLGAQQRREEAAARQVVSPDFYRFANDDQRVLHGRTLRMATPQGRDGRQLRSFPHLRLPNNEF